MTDSEELSRGLSALTHAGFAATGVATVVLGPAIPELAVAWGVEPAGLAGLFTAQFLVSSLGSAVSSLNPWRSVVAAYPLIAAGLLGLGLGGPDLALAAAATIGLGLGLAIPATNLVVAAASRHRRGAALSFLNLLWGVGAVACPLLFAALRGRVAAGPILVGLGLGVALLATALAIRLGRADGGIRDSGETASVAAPTSPSPPLKQELPVLALFAGTLFLYVGSESAAAGWLVTLADELGDATAASMLVHSAFWGALLIGRGLAPLILRRVREPTLYALCLAVSALGVIGLLIADSRTAVALAGAVTGLGMSGIFPLTVSALTAATEASGSRRVGGVFAFAGAGGAFLPWLVPHLAEAGSVQRGFLVPLAGIVLLAGLLAIQRFAFGQRSSPVAPARGGGR